MHWAKPGLLLSFPLAGVTDLINSEVKKKIFKNVFISGLKRWKFYKFNYFDLIWLKTWGGFFGIKVKERSISERMSEMHM